MRIYVADDSDDARDIIAATLTNGGYKDVNLAASGLELLDQLGVEPLSLSAPQADIIMLDVMMPDADGIETCARIRADKRYQDTPILMVTLLGDVDSLGQAFVAGANDYITKPFNRVELLARLRAALRLKGELDRRRERESELMSAARDLHLARTEKDAGGLHPATLLLKRQLVESFVAAARPPDAECLGVLAFQIDGLPRFRANYGAVAEAELLIRVAGVLARLPAQLGDLLTQYEGGVFVALLRNVKKREELARMAEKARQAVADLAVPHHGSGLRDIVTVSIGVAYRREPRALLPDAVSAMERAAGEGGDRILFDPA